MLLAALAMALLFWCLTQTLAELAAALPDAGGFHGYVRRALGTHQSARFLLRRRGTVFAAAA